MSSAALRVPVEALEAHAYEIPTATDEESDGTLVWDSTSVVVVQVHAGEHVGLGYSYCDPAAVAVIEGTLAELAVGSDPLMPGRCWAQMQREIRQLGHAGIAAMALSAVDVALWDLKARLLGVCLADALPRSRESVPIYGSGGFTNYDERQLREQAEGWARQGLSRVKIKVGREKDADLERLETVRVAVGEGVELMVDGNGAYELPEALLWARRFARRDVRWFEEPLSSQDLDGLARLRRRAPEGLAIAAGEYGWNLIDAQRMLDAGAVDILQADVTRCGGVTGMLAMDALCGGRQIPFSAHCAPAISAHVCCAMQSALHIEYFFDHVRIESMLFDGVLDPERGALRPDRSRPGLGLELKAAEAERYRRPAMLPTSRPITTTT